MRKYLTLMTALGESPSINDWEDTLLNSNLSHQQMTLFINLRMSEAIRAKMKYNLDHPK